ncbi:hypothetical protein Tco_1181931 [Tanacetum coccineum]
MHTVKVEYEWKPPKCGTHLVFGNDDAHCPKHVIADLINLKKQGGTSNDGFQNVQRKGVRDPLVSKHEARDNGQPVDDLVDGTSKKVGAPFRKNGIWWSRKVESSSESGFTSPSPFNFLTRENGKSILCDLHESDDDADVENSYNEMTTLLAS